MSVWSWLERKEKVLLLGSVAGALSVSVLLLGGATPTTASWVAACALLGVGLGLFRGLLVWNGLSVTLALLGLWGGLAALPLPPGWARRIAPLSTIPKQATLGLLGDGSSWLSWALEPGAAISDSWRLGLYALWASLIVGVVKKYGRSVVAWLLLGVACLLEAATLGHQLFDASTVFGAYVPQHSRFVAPLLNPNNLAGVLNIGVFSGVGLALGRRVSLKARCIAAGGVLVLVAGSVWSGSRAGLAFLALGVGLVGLVLALAGRAGRRGPPRAGVFLLGGCLSLGVCFALFSQARLRSELMEATWLKLDLLRFGWKTAGEFFWVGAGRGAFSAASAPWAPSAGNLTFEHAENLVFEALVGFGAPVTCLALLWLGILFRPSARLVRSSYTKLGLYVGALVWFGQNMFDLGSEIFGVGLFATTAFASVCGVVSGQSLHRTYVRLGTHGVLLAVVLVGLVWLPTGSALGARARVAALSQPLSLAKGAPLADALSRHPVDAYLLRRAALASFEEHRSNTFAWIGLALKRRPNDGRTLLLLGRILFENGKVAQSQGALRQAVAAEPALVDAVAGAAFAWYRGAALEVAPQGAARVAFLRRLAVLEGPGRRRLEYLKSAFELEPEARGLRAQLASSVLGQADELCREVLGLRCVAVAERHASRLPKGQARVMLEARLMSHRGAHAEAMASLRRGCQRSRVGIPCLKQLFATSDSLPFEEQVEAARLLLDSACWTGARCAHTEKSVALQMARGGHLAPALVHLERAAHLLPTPPMWLGVVKLAVRAESLTSARRAQAELSHLGVKLDKDLAAELERLGQDRFRAP